jgi:surface-anchored protein
MTAPSPTNSVQTRGRTHGHRGRPSGLRRAASLVSTFALSTAIVAGFAVPSAAATEEDPRGATLVSVTQTEAGQLDLTSARSDGSLVNSDAVTFVSPDLSFSAIISAEDLVDSPDDAAPDGSGPVRVNLVSFEAPGEASVTVSPVGTDERVFSTLDGGARSASIIAGERLTSTWSFSDPGTYRLVFAASRGNATDGTEQTTAERALSFRIAEPSVSPTDPDGPITTPPTNPPVTPGDPTPPEVGLGDPAPQPGTRRVLSEVHTDAVSTFFDDGHIALDTKADIAEGIGTRLDADEVLFNIEPASLFSGGVPALDGFGFLGTPGSPLWLAPQVADPDILWPGFSTEDPNLAGKLDGNSVNYKLVSAVGPGSVEVFQITGGSAPKRWFSSSTRLDPVTFSVPQHAHANWAFSAEGRYELTFTATANVQGVVQSATRSFVFHVGDIAESAVTTEVSLTSVTADATGRLAATVRTPAISSVSYEPTGWVEIHRGNTGSSNPDTLDGFTRIATLPVVNGRVTLDTDATTTGAPVYVAKFVPRFSNEFTGSQSEPFRQLTADTAPIAFDQLGERGNGLAIVSPNVSAGASLTVSAPGRSSGSYLSSWLYLDPATPSWLGWTQLDSQRRFEVRVPADAVPGTYRLAAKSEDGSLIGWDEFTVGRVEAPVPPAPPAPTPPAPDQGDGAPGAIAPPSAAAKACAPGTVLESGHIDAFNVTANGDQLLLQLKEDVTGRQVIREAESVLLRVKESAWQTGIPASFPGSPSGYVLPLTQSPSLIWPGWDTNRTAGSGFTDVSINVTSVSGPGRVNLYTLAGFGTVSSLLTSGGYSLPGTIREPSPVHTHAQWVFSSKGMYKLTVDAVATNPATGQSIRSAPHTYVFQVGNVDLGSAFCGVGAGGASAVGAAANQPLTEEEQAAIAAAHAAAMAAEQAEAAKGEESRSAAAGKGGADGAEDALAQILGEQAPIQLYAVLGGGLLLLVAIGAGTVWIVRRRTKTVLP